MADVGDTHVLVTGGVGFIGRRVVRALLAAGADVTVADKRGAFPDSAVRSVVGDLQDPEVVSQSVTPDTEVIIHLAALTRVLDSVKDPAGTYANNVGVTQSLLERARQCGTGTFLLASTNAVTGNVGSQVIHEQMPVRPLTPYGATKAAAEMLVGSYAACYGMNGCSLRFTNVYGPGMAEKDSFVPRLMRAARDGHGVQVYGDGSMQRDLVHVDDIVDGIFAAWEHQVTGPLILGAGESVTIMDMIAAARAVTGAELPVEHVPAKPGEMPAVIVDISAARALGYQPKHDLKSGLGTVWPEFAEDQA
jgi:UDP-glucose 4-epimerase